MGKSISSLNKNNCNNFSRADFRGDDADKQRAKQQNIFESNKSDCNCVVTQQHTTPARSPTRKALNISTSKDAIGTDDAWNVSNSFDLCPPTLRTSASMSINILVLNLYLCLGPGYAINQPISQMPCH